MGRHDRHTSSDAHRDDPKFQQALDTSRSRRARNLRFAEKAAFGGIHWDYYQHYAMYDMIMKANPASMGQRAQQWSDLAHRMADTTAAVQQDVTALLQTWRGAAAVGAARSNSELTAWAEEMSHKASQIGAGLAQYAEAVEVAQKRMPPPEFAVAEQNHLHGFDVEVPDGPSGALLIDALLDDHKPNADKAKAAKAEAVRVMQTYAGQSQQVHDDMPWFYDAPAAASPGAPEPPFTDGGGPGPQDPLRPPDRDPRDRPPVSPEPSDSGSGVPGDIDGDGISDTTTPDAFPGTGSGGLAGTGTGLPGGGFGATGGFGGAAGLGGGGAEFRAGQAGVPGGYGSFGGVGAGGGSGGMYPPMAGAGSNGEEDKEHTNKYDNGLDLFDDIPPAYPPVFGA